MGNNTTGGGNNSPEQLSKKEIYKRIKASLNNEEQNPFSADFTIEEDNSGPTAFDIAIDQEPARREAAAIKAAQEAASRKTAGSAVAVKERTEVKSAQNHETKTSSGEKSPAKKKSSSASGQSGTKKKKTDSSQQSGAKKKKPVSAEQSSAPKPKKQQTEKTQPSDSKTKTESGRTESEKSSSEKTKSGNAASSKSGTKKSPSGSKTSSGTKNPSSGKNTASKKKSSGKPSGKTSVSSKPVSKAAEISDDYQEEEELNFPEMDVMTVGFVGAGLVAAVVLMYIIGLISYNGRYLPNTYMNGVNIGRMTRQEAVDAVLSEGSENRITFVQRDGTPVVFDGADYGSTLSIAPEAFDEADKESHAAWFRKLFNSTEYQSPVQNTYEEASIRSMVQNYDWHQEPVLDAEIMENGDGTFYIRPENIGNSIKTDVLAEYAIEQLRNGEYSVDMLEANCYNVPEVTEADLSEVLDEYNAIGSISVTFDMTNREEIFDPVGTETLDFNTFGEWITVIDNKLFVDKVMAADWIRKNIAEKYDTLIPGYTRKFKSTLDGTVDVTFGDNSIYGWETDVEATAQRLADTIENRKSGTIEPVYSQEGFRMHSEEEGYSYTKKTYVEVSLTHQHLWYYVDGELFYETDCVTGMQGDPSRETHPGIFYVWKKESPSILGTYAVEGYEQYVQFWMPIDHIGIGLHDLSRGAYGGTIYQYNGSHGCINLSYGAAETIYYQMVVGTPVVITP